METNIQEVLAILIPLISLMGWVYYRIDRKLDRIDKKFDKVFEELKEIKTELKFIDQRLSRLEGAFLERGQWEGRLYSMQKVMESDAKKN